MLRQKVATSTWPEQNQKDLECGSKMIYVGFASSPGVGIAERTCFNCPASTARQDSHRVVYMDPVGDQDGGDSREADNFVLLGGSHFSRGARLISLHLGPDPLEPRPCLNSTAASGAHGGSASNALETLSYTGSCRHSKNSSTVEARNVGICPPTPRPREEGKPANNRPKAAFQRLESTVSGEKAGTPFWYMFAPSGRGPLVGPHRTLGHRKIIQKCKLD